MDDFPTLIETLNENFAKLISQIVHYNFSKIWTYFEKTLQLASNMLVKHKPTENAITVTIFWVLKLSIDKLGKVQNNKVLPCTINEQTNKYLSTPTSISNTTNTLVDEKAKKRKLKDDAEDNDDTDNQEPSKSTASTEAQKRNKAPPKSAASIEKETQKGTTPTNETPAEPTKPNEK